MSSQDVTNGLKAYIGLMGIGPSCFGATLLTSELSSCVIPSVTALTGLAISGNPEKLTNRFAKQCTGLLRARQNLR
jgi:hypothetical protein